MYKGVQQKHRFKNLDSKAQGVFEKSGSGPLKKTFKYDPTKTQDYP